MRDDDDDDDDDEGARGDDESAPDEGDETRGLGPAALLAGARAARAREQAQAGAHVEGRELEVVVRQLEAAAARGDRGGDHEAALELLAVARHHHHRAATTTMGRHRTSAVLAEAQRGGYGRDGVAATRAVAADLVRALTAACTGSTRP